MSRKQWIVLAGIAVVAGFIAWLARSSRQPPLLPVDDVHAVFESAATCLSCHGPEGAVPQASRHPLGDKCLRCHGTRR
jgi:cytochrome c553